MPENHQPQEDNPLEMHGELTVKFQVVDAAIGYQIHAKIRELIALLHSPRVTLEQREYVRYGDECLQDMKARRNHQR